MVKKTKKKRSTNRDSQPRNDAERAAAEAAIRAVREARARIREARDPKSSMEAYAAVYAAVDGIARDAIAAAEEDASDEEPDVVVADGVKWTAVLTSPHTYKTLRGGVRVVRKLYRSERNGPTRCFFEERRGVVDGGFMPDLGVVVLETQAELSTETAQRLIKRMTGQDLSTATMKRTATSLGNALRDEETEFVDEYLSQRTIPEEANAVVISVDGLSFNLREEGYRQATVAAISLLDARGERLEVVKLGEMPESGKQTIMERVQREVQAITRRRPDLLTEVVIDGAADLRDHLTKLFPHALHVTDFFHVMEHIAEALCHITPDDEKQRDEQRRHLCHVLKHDPNGAKYVRKFLREALRLRHDRLSAVSRRIVAGHECYIEKQQPFLVYTKAANDNLDLGSGAVEAACKTLVTQRMKISGARWSRHGARAFLYLRSLTQSGRLDAALGFHQEKARAA